MSTGTKTGEGSKKLSEEKRGSLTAEKNGVVSEFLVATEYSPLR